MNPVLVETKQNVTCGDETECDGYGRNNTKETLQCDQLMSLMNSVQLRTDCDLWRWEGPDDGSFTVADCRNRMYTAAAASTDDFLGTLE
ncbi:hypothetical protein M8C21_020871 [Ambrosia artemisiifolia]|uniref:Uncharacterized protein n=1 Tax=Ambrosia artemisiifolia TaxID=4212 RepID=A0AAD5CEM4_AMBAR|nr:hypothetical protein M8C21_020871 [Ambrosia artemisiifolia]